MKKLISIVSLFFLLVLIVHAESIPVTADIQPSNTDLAYVKPGISTEIRYVAMPNDSAGKVFVNGSDNFVSTNTSLKIIKTNHSLNTTAVPQDNLVRFTHTAGNQSLVTIESRPVQLQEDYDHRRSIIQLEDAPKAGEISPANPAEMPNDGNVYLVKPKESPIPVLSRIRSFLADLFS
ncbi:hypothetical protein GF345_01320 [Candidatus Woesearchaeota archaeon]|nr:hypothetical protein [Candidatus Woesearchaeota archaeon]